MDIKDYQASASETIQFNTSSKDAIYIALLGIAGEAGELLTEYKKKIVDGDSYKIFEEKLLEELGDIIWYVSTIATLENISMQTVLDNNLRKIQERWHDASRGLNLQLGIEPEFFDDGYEEDEKLPREFIAEFYEVNIGGKNYIEIKIDGKEFGDPIRDNAYIDDFYRFHDIFHFSYVVVLGWSPVTRKFLKCKRKSEDDTDEVQDGGRASVIDEAISILVFEHARSHSFYEGVEVVDYNLLRTIKMLTKHLEVNKCTTREWEKAILMGFKMWHKLKDNKGGKVICNMIEKTMIYEPLK